MEKRLIIAIVLSVLVIMSFQYFIKPAQKPQVFPQQAQTTAGSVPAEKVVDSYSQPMPSVPEIYTTIETERYILIFSNIGGSLKSVTLKDFKELNSDQPLKLIDIKHPADYLFAINDPMSRSQLTLTPYELKRTDGAIVYRLRTKSLDIIKEYILHNSSNIIELRIYIKNVSGSTVDFNYRITGGSNLSEPNKQDSRFVEITAKINGKPVKFKRPREGRIINPGLVSWTALKSKYFSIILKPFVNTRDQFYRTDADGNLVMGVETEPTSIMPNSSVEQRYILYIGPNQISVLKEVGYELDEVVNYGFFGGISKALLFVLRFFYSVFHNWGVSIILLAVFLNIILFPLTMKSFKSMQKMQELHPQMEKLRAQHKDNPQKLNKEIMELYKTYKINPFSGCLPMLLQMPIFIALYQGLMRSIELRTSGFLWIRDLSSPEAIPLPVTFPIIGNTINILPLVMVAAMVMQQKLSSKSTGGAVSEEQKQQQKMMLIIMPVVFGFIFYNMPSGLVLYWVVNTLLTITEQAVILKKD